MRLTILCLTFALGLISCKKESLDLNAFWQCNLAQNLDSTAISNKLLGSWKWATQTCAWGGKTTKADKNIKVTFKNDNTFSLSEGSNILKQGTWKIRQWEVNLWKLDLSSPTDYLDGTILFCDNQVVFNDSSRDLCDNLFNKIN